METQTFGKAWAAMLFNAANARAVMLTFNSSRGVSTRASRRAQMTRPERVIKYSTVLRQRITERTLSQRG